MLFKTFPAGARRLPASRADARDRVARKYSDLMKRWRVLLAFAALLLSVCCNEAICQTVPPDLACKYVREGSDVKRLNGGRGGVLHVRRIMAGDDGPPKVVSFGITARTSGMIITRMN